MNARGLATAASVFGILGALTAFAVGAMDCWVGVAIPTDIAGGFTALSAMRFGAALLAVVSLFALKRVPFVASFGFAAACAMGLAGAWIWIGDGSDPSGGLVYLEWLWAGVPLAIASVLASGSWSHSGFRQDGEK